MNAYMVTRVILQWKTVCGNDLFGACVESTVKRRFSEGGDVYNVIMDFGLALFPWFITWNLDMQRLDKIGLSIVLSLVCTLLPRAGLVFLFHSAAVFLPTVCLVFYFY